MVADALTNNENGIWQNDAEDTSSNREQQHAGITSDTISIKRQRRRRANGNNNRGNTINNPRNGSGKNNNKGKQKGNKGNDNNATNGPQSNNNSQRQLQAFFDNLQKLQHRYGSDVITVQDANDVYPILRRNRMDCPFSYKRGEIMDNDHPPSVPCYTPIITIHDRIANSWGSLSSSSTQQQQAASTISNEQLPEVVLLSGIDSSPSEMDVTGPSSILETIRLLLECARCEALSPWVVHPDDDRGDGNNIGGEGIKEDDDELGDGSDDAFNENDTTTSTTYDGTDAIQCRQELASQGIDDAIRKWLARLVATRRIVAVPIVDVAGFYNRLVQLETGQMSPDPPPMGGAECDFPFPFHWKSAAVAGQTPNACMTTYPARLVNELFRSHAFQLGLAFHGSTNEEKGTSSYIEWPIWNDDGSVGAKMTPDEVAMFDISWAYSKFGAIDGNNLGLESVRASHASSLENGHNGCRGSSLEHFSFSAGMVEGGAGVNNEGSLWMEQCQCNDAGGDTCAYPPEQTGLYDGSSLRAFVARVVAPSSSSVDQLPGFDPHYDPSNLHDYPHALDDPTHLGINARMSLLATELVEPWTAIRSIAGVKLRDDDVIPLSPRAPGQCMRTRVMEMPESPLMNNVTVTWTVGGALSVDETAIMHGKRSVLDKKIFDCVTQPTKQELDAFFTILRDFEVMEGENEEEMAEDVSFTHVQSGVTRWHSSVRDAADSSMTIPPETTFSVSLDLSDYKVGDVIAIYALARTDQDWIIPHLKSSFALVGGDSATAQSNIVNARTNPQWSHAHTNSMDGGSLIKGHLDWFSVPVTIEIGPQPGFFQGNEPIEKSVRATDEGYEPVDVNELDAIAFSLIMAVVVIALTLICVFCREERDGTVRKCAVIMLFACF